MKVLVCGGRNFSDFKLLEQILDELDIDIIVHGDARGADRLSHNYALKNNIPVNKYPADWKRYGKSAGPVRNLQMLREEEPDLIVAFPGGRGTQHMVTAATSLGYKVKEI